MNAAGYGQLGLYQYSCPYVDASSWAGTLSFWIRIPSSSALTQFETDATSPSPPAGVACGLTTTELWENSFAPFAYDAVWSIAKALDETLTHFGCSGSGGACASKTPGEVLFQQKLREKIFGSSFSKLTGTLSISQCAGVNYAANGLGLSSATECGDRVEKYREIRNWNGNQWVKVADVDPSGSIQLTGSVQFLGGAAAVPVAVVSPTPCTGGYVRSPTTGACEQCAAGTYAPASSATVTYTTCLTCQADFYSFLAGASSCQACPDQATCYGGDNVKVLQGYWSGPTANADGIAGPYYRCFSPSSRCEGVDETHCC